MLAAIVYGYLNPYALINQRVKGGRLRLCVGARGWRIDSLRRGFQGERGWWCLALEGDGCREKWRRGEALRTRECRGDGRP